MPKRVALLLMSSVLLPGCRSLPLSEPAAKITNMGIDQSTNMGPDQNADLASASILPSTGDLPGLTMGLGDEIALRALSLVGKPYRYGGADLQGFDCSGLVFFIHQGLGIAVPRTAADQQRAAMSITRSALRPGDLLFFKTTRSTRISHVGVYVGENRFVHAPQTGKLIEVRTLDDQYYGPRLVGTGRLHPNS